VDEKERAGLVVQKNALYEFAKPFEGKVRDMKTLVVSTTLESRKAGAGIENRTAAWRFSEYLAGLFS